MAILTTLKERLTVTVLTKLLIAGVDKLHYEHLGQKLNAAMDTKFGVEKANAMQKKLAWWLRHVADELEA